MATAYLYQQQIDSFWNLIQSSDETVQSGLYDLLNAKYGGKKSQVKNEKASFLDMKGVLKSAGNKKKLSERLRGIGQAPEGFDYKEELMNRFE